MPLLVSAFAWHSTPNAHTGSPHCCQAAEDSSSQQSGWGVGGGGFGCGRAAGGRGGMVCIKTLLTLGYNTACVVIKRLCQQESGGSHAGGGMTQCAPTLLFHRQWWRKRKKTVKAQFELARTIAELGGQIIPTLPPPEKPCGCKWKCSLTIFL